MEPGVYFNLSNAEYHSGPGISKSQLDMVALSPALLKWQESAPVDEEKLQALDMGTALHCLLLEPDEFDKRFIVAPAFNRRTTAGKAAEAEFLAECYGMGMTVMDAEQGRKLKLMRDSALAHPAARWLLEAEGHCEASIYWNDDETGELCRIRPEKFLKWQPVVIDVKKVADMNRFATHVAEFRYHVQDAYYREGFQQQYGEYPLFVFIAVSESIDCGRYPDSKMAQVVRMVLIDVFKEAQHAGHVPPGYNPAAATKQPRLRVKRQRLSLEEWQKIFEIADARHRYMGNAMLLALSPVSAWVTFPE